VLEEHPGLQVLRSFGGAGGVGVQMQGLDAKYTLVLVDGPRATGRVGGTIDLSRFPAEDIEQVEIIKGPASALYGSDAIAGVINIITRRTRLRVRPVVRVRSGDARAVGPRRRGPRREVGRGQLLQGADAGLLRRRGTSGYVSLRWAAVAGP